MSVLPCQAVVVAGRESLAPHSRGSAAACFVSDFLTVSAPLLQLGGLDEGELEEGNVAEDKDREARARKKVRRMQRRSDLVSAPRPQLAPPSLAVHQPAP